jgi:hypothetical protein
MQNNKTTVWIVYHYTDYRKECDNCILRVFAKKNNAIKYADHITNRDRKINKKKNGKKIKNGNDSDSDSDSDEITSEYSDNDLFEGGYCMSIGAMYDKPAFKLCKKKNCEIHNEIKQLKLSWGLEYSRIAIVEKNIS